jgi:hypothetical protein
MTIKIDLGVIICTPAFEELSRQVDPKEIVDIANRHEHCDWGNIPEKECELNNRCVEKNVDYVLSSYSLGNTEVWIRTALGLKHERITTFMLPSDR